MNSQYDEPTQISPHGGSSLCDDSSGMTVPVAIIACHPDPNRLGEFASLDGLMQFKEQELSRHWPEFHPAGSSIGQGLNVPFVSRKPIRMERIGAMDIMFHRQQYSAPVYIDGQPLQECTRINERDLQRGVEVCLGDHVMLWLTCMPVPRLVHDDLGLVGISAAMHQVRERIHKVAPADEPVLIRGATGCGKELVAQALVRQSNRFNRPFVAVNIAALQPSLAVSELFGSTKGAYTGATTDRKGYFQAANTGTLFLDEIGEASQEVQAMLLRALENHEVVPVGATEAYQVDVRILAATDANLEQQGEGAFKQPLLHRLSSYQIVLPLLSERREDIPGLLRTFLQAHCRKTHQYDVLSGSNEHPLLTNDLMRQLLQAPWPGNVRQLRNVARQMLLDAGEGQPLRLDQQLLTMLDNTLPTPPEPTVATPAPRKRRPSQISQDELANALHSNRYELQATADQLGISRASVYQLIERHPTLRHTTDYSVEELEASYAAHNGDLERMMETLKVSQIGLRRRLRSMGFDA